MPARNTGFTLIELLITLSVAAIVLSIAMPSFNTQIRNNKSVTVTEEFVSALNFARAEAIKRSHRVSLCPSTDGVSCANDDEWHKGWIAIVDLADSDQKDEPVLDNSKYPVLRYWEELDPALLIELPDAERTYSHDKVASGVALTIPAITATNFVRFTSFGTLAQVSGNNSLAFVVNVSGCTGFNKGVVSIGVAGLISVSRVSCI